MNTTEILHAVSHREYPISTGPWVMSQLWLELLFAHWPIKPDPIRLLIPSAFTIDTFEGEAWIGVVPFRMRDIHPRGLPSVQGLSHFPELNVRTYVTMHGKPGVYFFSLDAGNPIAVALARSVFHLPYFNARMRCEQKGSTISYTSHRTHRKAPSAEYVAHYRPIAPVEYAKPKTLAHWLTERYSLYTTFRNCLYRGEIHHFQWPLQAAELEVEQDTMVLSHGLHLPDTAPLLHYSQRQEVLIWPLHRIL
ncbi:MAG: DUF2071 domain-containing protein [Ktedonobacteraceae bacterium]